MTALHDTRQPEAPQPDAVQPDTPHPDTPYPAWRHGLDLLRDTGLPSGTLYPTLIRLHRAGAIEADWHAGRRTYRARDKAGDQTGPVEPTRPQTAIAWLPAILVAVVTVYTTLDRNPTARLPDLHVYLGAVDGLRHGASLYDFTRDDAPFTYPPFAGLLFWPLTWAPTHALEIGWTLATAATVIWLARTVTATENRPLLALVLMLSAPVASDLRYGQVSLFLAAMVTIDVLHPSRAQGVLIGLAAAIKLTPLIFIPMLWVTGRRAAAVTATATFAASALLAAVLLPGDSWRFWTTEMFHVGRLGNITSVGNQSLNAALMRLDAPFRSAIVLIVGGLIAALALRRAARLEARDALIVVGAAGIVLSPVSWTHHQIWLVLAVLLPVSRWGKACLAAIMVLPITALDGPLWSSARLILAALVATAIPVRRAR
jgi:alpha-1,2-mannosyltransferase